MKKFALAAAFVACLVLSRDLTVILLPILCVIAHLAERFITANRGKVKSETLKGIINAFLEEE